MSSGIHVRHRASMLRSGRPCRHRSVQPDHLSGIQPDPEVQEVRPLCASVSSSALLRQPSGHSPDDEHNEGRTARALFGDRWARRTGRTGGRSSAEKAPSLICGLQYTRCRPRRESFDRLSEQGLRRGLTPTQVEQLAILICERSRSRSVQLDGTAIYQTNPELANRVSAVAVYELPELDGFRLSLPMAGWAPTDGRWNTSPSRMAPEEGSPSYPPR